MRRSILLALLVLTPFAVAACGGDGGGSADTISRVACTSPAFSGDSGLPADFPRPAEFTITDSRQEGPTRVVEGYWKSGLEEAYGEWKDAVERAGYDVTFDEQEEHDAEVAYDTGETSGLIALRDRCEEEDVTYVRITNRPS